MPELPEVEGLVGFLRTNAVGRVVARVDVAAISVLKTFDPPPTSLAGLTVTGVERHGKWIDLDVDGLHLVMHLSKAGWLRWSPALSPTPVRPGKGPIALRVVLDDGSGFDLTEAGTRKRAAVYVVRDPQQVPQIASLGPDPLAPGFDREAFGALLAGRRMQVKGLLRDQSVLAGVGNAYSDEVLHAARLSPFAIAGSLTTEQVDVLYEAMEQVLREAVAAAAAGPPPSSRTPSGPACGSTDAPESSAPCAATWSARSASPTPRCSTARPARPAASRWPTAGCPVC